MFFLKYFRKKRKKKNKIKDINLEGSNSKQLYLSTFVTGIDTQVSKLMKQPYLPTYLSRPYGVVEYGYYLRRKVNKLNSF